MRKSLSIEELAERWEWLTWEKGIEVFKISEYHNNRKPITYEISGLNMEFENKSVVVCSDFNGALIEKESLLSCFLRKHIISISLISIGNNYYKELIELKSGYILIEIV